MKITDNKQVRNRMSELFQVQAMNKAVDKYVLQSVNRSIKFNDYADIEKKADIFRKQMEEYDTHYTADESLIGAALMEHIYGNMEENEEFPFPTMIVDGMIRSSRVFHEGEIENNPYLRNIQFEKQSIGEFELSSNWIDRPMRETISIIAFSFIDFVCSSGTNGSIPAELINPDFFDPKVRPLVGVLKDMEINTAEDLDKAIDSDNLISSLSLEE